MESEDDDEGEAALPVDAAPGLRCDLGTAETGRKWRRNAGRGEGEKEPRETGQEVRKNGRTAEGEAKRRVKS